MVHVPTLSHADKQEALKAAADHILSKGNGSVYFPGSPLLHLAPNILPHITSTNAHMSCNRVLMAYRTQRQLKATEGMSIARCKRESTEVTLVNEPFQSM